MAEPLLVWGAGAIGGTVGASFKRAGHDVSFMQLAPVVAAGQRHGIACPKLAGLIAMIHAVEDGKRSLSDRNLAELSANDGEERDAS